MAGKARKHSQRDPRRVRDPIPVAPLRERVMEVMEERELTWLDVAAWCGMVDRRGKADTTRLRRRLGLVAESYGTKPNGRTYGGTKTEVISAPIAAAICRAVGVAPVEIRDPETGESIL